MIGHNPKLYEKKLWSELGAGEPVAVVECDDEVHEAERARRADRVAARARAAAARSPTSPSSTAPTTRRASSSRRCARRSIPYKVSGGQSFFDRAEIRDLCAWLRLIVNLDDDPAFLRAVTSPSAASATRRWPRLGAFAGRWKSSLFEALFAETLADALPRRAIAGCTSSAARQRAAGARARDDRAPKARRRCCSAG